MAQLEDIHGVGPATATALAEQGLGSVKKVAKAKVKHVAAVPGFGAVRARTVRNSARTLVEVPKAKKNGKKHPKAKKHDKKNRRRK
jgi:NAD-dependent DNA ligase